MAITYVSKSSNGGFDGLDVTLTLTGLAENDIVIVAYSENDATDRTMSIVDSGWTTVSDLYQSDVYSCNLGVFYKVMGATPDTEVTVNGHGNSEVPVVACALAMRGVDTTTPLDVAVTTATAGNAVHPNPPSIDYADAGCAVVAVGASANNSGSSQTCSFPTGYTTNNVGVVRRDTSITKDSGVWMGLNTAPSDPEDPGEFTLSNGGDTADSWCATTIALRPAAGGIIPQAMHHRRLIEAS
jgi:hypothetical protein